MEKKTINISDAVLKAIIPGFLIGVAVVFVIHFFGSWQAEAMPTDMPMSLLQERYQGMDAKVQDYALDCPFDELHVFKGNGATFNDIIGGHFSSVKFYGIISATFERHWKSIFLFGLIATLAVFISGKIKVNIIKESSNKSEINSQ